MARRLKYEGQPVLSVEDVANQCRLDPEDMEVDLLQGVIIPGVTAQAEARTGAAIRGAVFEEEWPEAYRSGHALEVGQATEVVSIGRVESGGGIKDLQPLPVFRLERGQRESFLHFPQGRPTGRLVIRYRGALDIDAYPGVKQWMLMHAATAHQQRETVVAAKMLHEIPASFIDSLLADIVVPPRF